MNHFAERKLSDWGKDTFVHWAVNPTGKAIVFIHGFNGSTVDTFSEFDVMFRDHPEFDGYDIYFFGYDSLAEPIGSSALLFRNFLNQIYDNSVSFYNISKPAKEKSRPAYQRIVVIAHSLGAVVARVALLEAYVNNLAWVENCSLILFAPAHKGASSSLSALISGKALPGLWKLISVAAGYKIPALKELESSSKLLRELEEETLKLITSKIESFTIAKEVIWASYDRVVTPQRFGKDPDATRFPSTNHGNVCKPCAAKRQLRALETVIRHL